MKKTLNKGFTLIELLVVIAIIGILAGVVLTSLGTARDRAKEASATSSMSSMRAEAELGADVSGLYLENLCTSEAGTGSLLELRTAAENALGGTPGSWTEVSCNQEPATGRPSAWAAGTINALSGGKFFCVDSSGFAGEQSTTLSGVECTRE